MMFKIKKPINRAGRVEVRDRPKDGVTRSCSRPEWQMHKLPSPPARPHRRGDFFRLTLATISRHSRSAASPRA